MSAFISKCKQQIQWFIDKPALVMIIAVIILFFGMYTIVVIAVFLFIWALGQMTGLGFGMSF